MRFFQTRSHRKLALHTTRCFQRKRSLQLWNQTRLALHRLHRKRHPK